MNDHYHGPDCRTVPVAHFKDACTIPINHTTYESFLLMSNCVHNVQSESKKRPPSLNSMVSSVLPVPPPRLSRWWTNVTARVLAVVSRREPIFDTDHSESEKHQLLTGVRHPDGTPVREMDYAVFRAVHEGKVDDLKSLTTADPYCLDVRGADGRTVLHLACLLLTQNNREKYEPIISHLIEESSKLSKLSPDKSLVNVKMGGQYAGEVAAHFLVVKQELGLLKKLVAVGADVVGYRADGDFFKPKDSPEDCFYFGEEILAFAACFGSTEIVEYLLTDCKVDPWQRDSHGNTALHVLAWWGFYNTNNWKDIDDRHNRDKKLKGRKPLPPSTACLGGTFVLIMDKMKEKLLNENLPYQNPLDALNRQRRTPLLVAVQRGHRHMVHALLEASGESQWAYGRVECMHYPLTYIDEPSTRAYFHKLQTATTPQTDTSAFETDTTALELAVDKEDKALLCTEPLFRHIIEEKWDRYAWDIYNTWVFGAFLFVVLIFIEILLIPKHPHYKLDGTLNDAYISRLDYTSPEAGRAGWWRAANEITVLLVILMYLVAMISDLVGRKDKAPWSRKKFIRLVGIRRSFATVLVTFAVAARFSGRDRPEDVALGLMAIFSWLCLLNYTKGFKRVGPLVMVFYRVLKEDLARWALLWFSLFLGFAEAVYLEMHATGLDDWTNPWEAVLTMFKWTFTQGEFEQLRQAIVPDLAKIYWLVFSIITIILLLNVLIAMMNQSFTAIMVEEDQQWHVERAKIVLSIDKKLGNFVQLVGFQREERGPYYFALNNVIPHAKYMARTHSVNEQVPVEPTAVNLPSVMASANQASSSGRH